MLIYLDGMRSVARQREFRPRALGALHWARAAAQADIRAAARRLHRLDRRPRNRRFRSRDREKARRRREDLPQPDRPLRRRQIIAILLRHPRTAETIVEKLWREFVSLKPDAGEVKRLAASFRNGYEIKPLMRSILLSAQFRDPANRGALIKSPIELIVGTVHVLGLPVPEKTQLVRMMQGLGQTPFDPPNVKGWAGGESWVTTYTLLLRQQFLRRIVEATAVASMEGGMMADRPNRRADRREQSPADNGMQTAEARPVEGRSLRAAGNEARLGPTLSGVDSTTLIRTLLPRAPIDTVDVSGTPGVAVAAAMLDTAYQLK
jgi:hypothetical protein